jgi:DNA-binding transcriptional LysR family regulator
VLTDLKKLNHVIEVARSGSFTGAAGNLSITQSALTKSVADVERRLGLQLFRRLPRGVVVTDAGRDFVRRARQIITDSEDLMDMVTAHRSLEQGRLRVGIAPSALQAAMIRSTAAFAEQYPGLTIEVSEGPSEAMVQALLRGEIDALIGMTSFMSAWPELQWRPSGALHYSFIGRLDHPAAAQSSLTEVQLLAYPMVLPNVGLPSAEAISRELARIGLPPIVPRYVCGYFPMAMEIVRRTDAISPVLSFQPQLGSRIRTAFHVFDDVVVLRPEAIAIATAGEPPPAARAFIDLVETQLAANRPHP